MHWIRSAPATNSRLLRKTPEGVDVLITEWRRMLSDLTHRSGCRWDFAHQQRAEALNGLDSSSIGRTSYHDWTYALKGNFSHLEPEEGQGLPPHDRSIWAMEALIEKVEGEIAKLEAHKKTLDLSAIETDRAYATELALFDPGKEATLARKYEAATERSIFRTIQELRQVEEEARADTGPLGPDPMGSSMTSDAAHRPEDGEPPLPPAWKRVGPEGKVPQRPQTARMMKLERKKNRRNPADIDRL